MGGLGEISFTLMLLTMIVNKEKRFSKQLASNDIIAQLG